VSRCPRDICRTTRERTGDPWAFALAWAQRRVWVLGSWWYGIIIAASGAVYALAAVLMGSDPETGAIMAVLGLALAGFGWVVSAPMRFSRKPPKPVMDVNRAEHAIRINREVVLVSNGVMVAAIIAPAWIMSPDAAEAGVPILAMLAVWAPMLGVLILRARKLLIQRQARYARWREDRFPAQ
jgi:hypothetical protein